MRTLTDDEIREIARAIGMPEPTPDPNGGLRVKGSIHKMKEFYEERDRRFPGETWSGMSEEDIKKIKPQDIGSEITRAGITTDTIDRVISGIKNEVKRINPSLDAGRFCGEFMIGRQCVVCGSKELGSVVLSNGIPYGGSSYYYSTCNEHARKNDDDSTALAAIATDRINKGKDEGFLFYIPRPARIESGSLALVDCISQVNERGILASVDHHKPNASNSEKARAMTDLMKRYALGKVSSKARDDHFFRLSKDAKIFVFQETPASHMGYGEEFFEIDPLFTLPFQTCWFECSTHPIATSKMPYGEMAILGFLIHENSPGDLDVYVFEREDDGELKVIYIRTTDRDDADFSYFVTKTVSELMKWMYSGHVRTGSANLGTKVKMKTSAGKEFHKIRKIIYIATKESETETFGSREVDWSHRWLVRGHWRKSAGIGKNRDGKYLVKGFTWVVEHEKGPEDMPLVADKVRVIKTVKEVEEIRPEETD